MNELQQVLVVFAIVVVLGLYFLQKNKSKQSAAPENEINPQPQIKTSRKEAAQALNNLGEPHISLTEKATRRLHVDEEEPVPENQAQLPFEEFELEQKPAVERKPKHVVIQAEEVNVVEGFSPEMKATDDKPSFGRPENINEIAEASKVAEAKAPQVFALIVMCTEASYSLHQIKQALLGVGLVASEMGIFVKKDTMGNDIIKVANFMEPGLFPAEDNGSFTTQGVVMILELPTTVKAPAVMHDMIMMARKVSQRLNGRIYNIERQLIKESDLQAMRDAAVAYESDAL